MTEAREFLELAFGNVPPDHWHLVWTLPDRKSYWFQGGQVKEADELVGTLHGLDVYIGAALSNRDRGTKRRGEATDVSGIIGLWADVDIEDFDAHRKTNLPASEDAAREVVASMKLAPTVLVHSGHGLQAWWLFEEPWTFDTDDDREEAHRLSMMWYATMRFHAAELGWTIDALHDLSRVMRLPGTTNLKGVPVPVRILDSSGPKYNPSDFDPFLIDEASIAQLSGRRTYRVGDLILSPAAQPDLDKFDALKANDAKFTRTVDRKRGDIRDNSPSGYDMALAAIAASAGWTDQEIANLIIYARRKHGDDLTKVTTRTDYLARTISAARMDRATVEAMDVLDEKVEQLQTTQQEVETVGKGQERLPHDRKAVLESLCDGLAIEIATVRCYPVEPEKLWEIVTMAGPLQSLKTSDLMLWGKVRSAVADKTKQLIRKFKGDEWNRIVLGIMAVAEVIEIGLETTDAGKAYSWLNDYLGDRMLLEDRDEACDTKQPYVDPEGNTFVFGQHLKDWLWMSKGERVNATRLGQVLRSFGCEYTKLNYALRGGRRSSSSAWKVPPLGEFEHPKYDKEDE